MQKLFILSALTFALNIQAAEYFVDPAKGSDSNSGDASAPFQTVVKALKTVDPEGGDTITLKGGVYRERFELGKYGVANIQATAEKPLIIQGALGERAIITGFEPITDWKDAGNGIYTAEVPELINGLFVGLEPQPLARWPRDIGLWMPFGEPNEEEMSFTVFDDLLKNCPDIETIAKDLRSLQIFMYINRPNVYGTKPVKALKPAEGKIVIDNEKWWANYTGKDYLALQNHPLFVKEPGDWAVAPKEEGAKEHTVYFKPKTPADLERAQYRTRGILASLRGASGITLRNIEFSGAGRSAVEISGADNTVEYCIAHNSAGSGISSRNAKNITFRSNIAVANEDMGITVGSTETALVEGNHIYYSMVDGLRVVGNAGSNPDEPNSSNVTVRRNYIHHHHYMSHPDNIQTFRGVTNLTIEENVLLFGGQNTMTEQNSDSTLRNNVSLFTEAYITIFGHKSAHRWLVERNTFGYGGWGSFIMDSDGIKFYDNIYIGTGFVPRPDTVSDHNVFITRPWSRVIYLTMPGHKRHTELEAARDASGGLEANSIAIEDLPFKNMPKAFSVTLRRGEQGKEPGKRDWVNFRTQGGGGTIAKAPDFAVGDNIELNGDGIMRKVTAVDDAGIQFAPELPTAPFRGVFVLNWGEGTSTQLDLTIDDAKHPIMTAARDGKRAGSTLDIAEFQRGELLEKGKRTLPAIPDDLQPAWPNPNYNIPPMYGR